jgi:hypothetical protein
MRDAILWRLRAQECAWIDCDTKYEWIGDIRNNEMKITKSQLKQIIKEELEDVLSEAVYRQQSVQGGRPPEKSSRDREDVTFDTFFDLLLKMFPDHHPQRIMGATRGLEGQDINGLAIATNDEGWDEDKKNQWRDITRQVKRNLELDDIFADSDRVGVVQSQR